MPVTKRRQFGEEAAAEQPPLPAIESVPPVGTIATWCRVSGMSRSQTYEAIAAGWLQARKYPHSRRTLIDIEAGVASLRSQPTLQLGRRDAA